MGEVCHAQDPALTPFSDSFQKQASWTGAEEARGIDLGLVTPPVEVTLGHHDAGMAEAVLWAVAPMLHRDFEPPLVASRSELAGCVEVVVVVVAAWVLLEVVRWMSHWMRAAGAGGEEVQVAREEIGAVAESATVAVA
jgi:hypothetical protein